MINKPGILYSTFFKGFQSFLHSFSTVAATVIFLFIFELTGFANNPSTKIWVGTWSTAPQLVEPSNMPPAPGLNNNTLRQVVCVSIGGDSLRLRFSNEFSTSAVTMKAVRIAVSTGGSAIAGSTSKELKFNGNTEITMNPGITITSDPISFHLKPRMSLAITIAFGETSPDVTGHPGSRTTSYLLTGDQTSSSDFASSTTTDHWYIINGIDVKAPESSAAVAILGNSITDGRGSGINKQNRWTDILSEHLLKNPETQYVGVLNLGIGGNCILKGGLGPTAISRFDRDILKQSHVKWVIILEGINDIGGIRDSTLTTQVAQDLITAYSEMIDKAHAKGLKVYGATILPFKKSFYDKSFRQTVRDSVNEWIRTSGRFDAVIDFDKVMTNPNSKNTIKPDLQSGDFLHPNEAGYKMMGEAVDLKLFEK